MSTPDPAAAGQAETAVAPVSSGAAGLPIELVTGARVDRYEIVRRVGAGGMGIVYLARDTELARDVALKLVRPRTGTSAAMHARLRREAQAMARLSHRNVVPVFDIGALDDRLFIAMELCDGGTLREWLAAPRPWREVVRALAAAGRGLAAAHAAGLVHRDFKPDNVLLAADGTVRVSDFGLVRAADGLAEPLEGATGESAVAGTIGYMAPEQIRGGEVTAAADQFAFCVTLHEALYGEPPFVRPAEISTAIGLLAEITGRRRRPAPRDRRVPSWAERVIARGLAPDPAARWPSMAAVVDALERGLGRRRRGLIAAGLLGVIATGAGAALAATALAAAPGDPCAGAEARLAAVWSPSIRAEIGDRGAPEAAAIVATRLDDHGRRWIAGWRDACRASRVDRVQSAASLELRTACLARQRDRVAAVVRVLRRASADDVRDLVRAPPPLDPPEACADAELLGAVAPPAPTVRAQVAAAETALDDAAAAYGLGGGEAALAAARAVRDQARVIGHPPLLARALLVAGKLAHKRGLYDDAEHDLFEASTTAEAARAHAVTADARLELSELVRRRPGDEGLRWVELAAAAAQAARRDDLILDARLARIDLLIDGGRLEEALALAEPAEVDARADDEAVHDRAAAKLGQVYALLGRVPDAERVVAPQCERLEGASTDLAAAAPDDIAFCGQFRAAIAQSRGDATGAVAHMQRATSAYERVYGPRASEVADALTNLAAVTVDVDPAAAVAIGERALAIFDELQGPAGVATLLGVRNLAAALTQAERPDDALALLRARLELARAAVGDDHPRLIELNVNLGATFYQLRRWDEGIAALTDAIAAMEQQPGAAGLAVARWNLGRMLLQVERFDEGLATLARAREEAVERGDLVLAAQARFSRGHGLWFAGRKAEARAEVQRALDEMPAGRPELRAVLEKWLVDHRTR